MPGCTPSIREKMLEPPALLFHPWMILHPVLHIIPLIILWPCSALFFCSPIHCDHILCATADGGIQTHGTCVFCPDMSTLLLQTIGQSGIQIRWSPYIRQLLLILTFIWPCWLITFFVLCNILHSWVSFFLLKELAPLPPHPKWYHPVLTQPQPIMM